MLIPSQGDAALSAHKHQHPAEHSLLWRREPKAAPGQQPGSGTRSRAGSALTLWSRAWGTPRAAQKR